MFVGGFVDHLIYPFTYTTSQGDVKHLSTKDISHIARLVLSGLVIATIEALWSSRSLKSSCISIVIIVCAAFYHGAFAMKIAHRCAEPEVNAPISTEVGISESVSKQEGDKSQDLKSVHNGVASTAPQQPDPLQKASDAVLTGVNVSTSTEVGISESVSKQEGDKSQDLKSVHNGAASTAPQQKAGDVVSPGSNGSSTASRADGTPIHSAPLTMVEAQEPQLVIPQRKSYQELTPTESEAKIICTMIYTIGNTLLPMLWPKETQLIKWGGQVAHIHPLKFLETVLRDEVVKQSMRDIFNEITGSKWNGFLRGKGESPGFIFKCEREDDAENFASYLPEFCAAVKVDFQKANSLVEAKKWKEFIQFVITS